jgi:hypothetical protein
VNFHSFITNIVISRLFQNPDDDVVKEKENGRAVQPFPAPQHRPVELLAGDGITEEDHNSIQGTTHSNPQ